MDAHLPEWLWPIALFGGLGAFIDFLLGRAGQARARRFLEEWWIRFDDVRSGNFGQREALFAVNMLDRWCGSRLFSLRRWVFSAVVVTIMACFGYLIALFRNKGSTGLTVEFVASGTVLLSMVALATSISITRAISFFVVNRLEQGVWKDALLFCFVVAGTYVSLACFPPILFAMKMVAWALIYFIVLLPTDNLNEVSTTFAPLITGLFSDISFDPRQIIDDLWRSFDPDPAIMPQDIPVWFISYTSGYLINVLRILVSLVFIASFAFQPLLKRPLSLIWLRVVESEKPIFTLVLGGVASIATAMSQVAKHL